MRDTWRAMPPENVDIVRSIYADPRGLTGSDKVAPHAVFDFSEVYPDSPIARGVEELLRFRDGGPWSGSPIRFEPERFLEIDNERVLVLLRISATGHKSGVTVDIRAAHEITIRDKVLVRFKAYDNAAEALEAVGLSE